MKTRWKRHLFKLLGTAILCSFISSAWSQTATRSVNIFWRIPAEQASTVQRTLQATPEQFSAAPDSYNDDRGLPLVYILATSAVIVELSRAILAIYKDARYGGVVVSSVKDKLIIENNPSIAAGTIVIKDKDGKVSIHEGAQDTTLEKLTGYLIAILPGSSK